MDKVRLVERIVNYYYKYLNDLNVGLFPDYTVLLEGMTQLEVGMNNSQMEALYAKLKCPIVIQIDYTMGFPYTFSFIFDTDE